METPSPYFTFRPYIAGLDIGQLHDPSALTVLERDISTRTGKVQARYDARWLERFPLQTPYPAMARLVRDRLEKLKAGVILVIDVTGVGRGMVDLFREEWMTVDPLTQERRIRPDKPAIVAVTLLTSAMHTPTAPSWDEHHVPKRDVVMRFMVALQQQRFRAAKSLKEAAILFKEGQNFQWKVSQAGNDQYGAWRDGQHDDLLLSAAIAVWWGEVHGRVPVAALGSSHQRYAIASGNPHAPRGQAQQPQVASGGSRR
jgi:hypothetical protein